MRQSIFLSLIAFSVCFALTTESLAADGMLCISRTEENGVLNIRSAQLNFDGKPLLSVVGGDNKCIAVPVGDHTVEVTSPDPYNPSSQADNGWVSKPLNIIVLPKHTKSLIVEPISKDATYTGPWSVRELK